MAIFYILLAVAITLSCFFILIQHPKKPLISFMFKGLASVSVLILGVYACKYSGLIDSVSGMLFLAGLGFCILGDVLLALLEFKIKDAKYNIINAGSVSFFLAHICFITAICFLIGGNGVALSIPFLFGILFVGIIYLIQKPMSLNYGKSTAATLIYSFGLSTALATSVSYMIIASFSLASIILACGLLFFLISDLILSMIYFKENSPRVLYYPNLSTYYIAIILIACSLVCF